MPADFGFRLEFGACTKDVVDSFEGLYVRDLDGGGKTISARVSLAADSREAVYRAVEAARFFEYPTEYRVEGTGRFRPAASYRLEVLNAGRRHTVAWADDRQPSTGQEDRLREMFRTIVREVLRNPGVSKLPKAEVICR
jgi:hypothetical protein